MLQSCTPLCLGEERICVVQLWQEDWQGSSEDRESDSFVQCNTKGKVSQKIGKQDL